MLKSKISSIQGLRGYAILLIFLSHCNSYKNETGIILPSYLGALGVSIFIMISGYLFVYCNSPENTCDVIKRLKKKLIKLYPLHFVTLIVSLPFYVKLLTSFDVYALAGFFANIFLLQSWFPFQNIYFSYNAVAWYLSLNIFLVIISLIWRDLFKHTRNWILIIVSLIFAEYFLATCFYNSKYNHWILYICPLVRLFDFIIAGGVKLCLQKYNLQSYTRMAKIGVLLSILALFILTYYSVNHNSVYFLSFTWCIPIAILIASLDICKNNENLINCIFSNKWIVFIGEISFEIFLYHWLIIIYLNKLTSLFDVGSEIYILTFFITIFLSYMTHYNDIFGKKYLIKII